MSEDAQYIFLPNFHQVINTLTEICLPFVVLCLVCSQANNSGQVVIYAVHEGQGWISRLTFGTPVPATTGGVTGLIVSALTNEVVKATHTGSDLLMDWKWSEVMLPFAGSTASNRETYRQATCVGLGEVCFPSRQCLCEEGLLLKPPLALKGILKGFNWKQNAVPH